MAKTSPQPVEDLRLYESSEALFFCTGERVFWIKNHKIQELPSWNRKTMATQIEYGYLTRTSLKLVKTDGTETDRIWPFDDSPPQLEALSLEKLRTWEREMLEAGSMSTKRGIRLLAEVISLRGWV